MVSSRFRTVTTGCLYIATLLFLLYYYFLASRSWCNFFKNNNRMITCGSALAKSRRGQAEGCDRRDYLFFISSLCGGWYKNKRKTSNGITVWRRYGSALAKCRRARWWWVKQRWCSWVVLEAACSSCAWHPNSLAGATWIGDQDYGPH